MGTHTVNARHSKAAATASARAPGWHTGAAALALLFTAAAAQATMDPMRPLPGMPTFGKGAALPPVAATGRAEALATTRPAATAPTAAPAIEGTAATLAGTNDPRLVALRSDAAGRRDALVEDRWVRTGDRSPWGRVIAIHDDRIELATATGPTPARAGSAEGRRTLYLLPRLLPSGADAAEHPTPTRTRQP